MKVTTEKLPRSLLAVDVELDKTQVEKGLDRAARRIAQKADIPGFRRGKAPRFIIENYFGREALLEEATDDLINTSFKEVLKQEQIVPVGQPRLENVEQDPFRFRVTVPVSPTVTLPDYRAIRVELEAAPVGDAQLQDRLAALREKHVVLQALEEPRPAQQGDQLSVLVQTILDGEVIDAPPEGQENPPQTMVLEPDRLAEGLFEKLLGIEVGEQREIEIRGPADHSDERVRDKDVTLRINVLEMQARLLPEPDELPVLENFEGDLEAFHAKLLEDMRSATKNNAERETIDTYIDRLAEQTEFDIPDAMIDERAHELLHEQGEQFSRYGITLEQLLQYRGQTHDQAVEELKPEAERRLKISLALQELIKAENLQISPDEVEAEIQLNLRDTEESARGNMEQALRGQFFETILNVAMDKKLRVRLLELATGTAPAAVAEQPVAAEPASEPVTEPASEDAEPAQQ